MDCGRKNPSTWGELQETQERLKTPLKKKLTQLGIKPPHLDKVKQTSDELLINIQPQRQ